MQFCYFCANAISAGLFSIKNKHHMKLHHTYFLKSNLIHLKITFQNTINKTHFSILR